MQQRFPKRISGISGLSYVERLCQFGLGLPEFRRIRVSLGCVVQFKAFRMEIGRRVLHSENSEYIKLSLQKAVKVKLLNIFGHTKGIKGYRKRVRIWY